MIGVGYRPGWAVGLLLLVAVVATTGCATVGRAGGGDAGGGDAGGGDAGGGSRPSGGLPSIEEARKEASKALRVIQFLDHNRHNVAETLGFRTGEEFGTVVLADKPEGGCLPGSPDRGCPLPVFEISRKDLRRSAGFSEFLRAVEAGEVPMGEEERQLLYGPEGNKPPMNFTELLDRLPTDQVSAETRGVLLFMEMMGGNAQQDVLEKLGQQEPEIWVFQATKKDDPGHLTPIVVRLPEGDRTRWRLFKVGQAPLAKTLRCNPDALYILDIPALYLSYVARPVGQENPAADLPECQREEPPALHDDCLMELRLGETAMPHPDQRPSADDCLIAIHSFPDLYGIEAGQRGLFSDWFPLWEVIAKTWQGSVESSLRQWKKLAEPDS